MNQDDYSRETLKTRHPAEDRLFTISEAIARLEAAVAVKLAIEQPPLEVQNSPAEAMSTETKEVITSEAAPEMQVGVDGELDITFIRSRVEKIYSDQLDELDVERAA